MVIGKDLNTRKLVKKSVYAKTEPECIKKLRKLAYEYDIGAHFEPSKMLYTEWLNTWLDIYKSKNLCETTYWNYETNIRVHITPYLGIYALKDITADIIQRHVNALDDKGLSQATIKKVLSLIKASLAKAEETHKIQRSPTKGITIPKNGRKKKVNALTPAEQKVFMEAIKGEKYYTFFMVALFTGLRIGEIVALLWKNINPDSGIIKVEQTAVRVKDYSEDAKTKTKKIMHQPKTENSIREVPMPPKLISILNRHKEQQEFNKNKRLDKGLPYNDADYVFTTYTGNTVDNRNIMRAFYRILKDNHLPKYNFHSLRHSYASRLHEKGHSIKMISGLLGHTDVAFTANTYTHIFQDEQIESVAALDDLIE